MAVPVATQVVTRPTLLFSLPLCDAGSGCLQTTFPRTPCHPISFLASADGMRWWETGRWEERRQASLPACSYCGTPPVTAGGSSCPLLWFSAHQPQGPPQRPKDQVHSTLLKVPAPEVKCSLNPEPASGGLSFKFLHSGNAKSSQVFSPPRGGRYFLWLLILGSPQRLLHSLRLLTSV